MIDGRLRNRRWLLLDRHVYALPSVPATWLRQAKAAQLSVPGSALSGKAAGMLYGLDGVRAGRLEVSTTRGRRRTSRLARVRHRDQIPTTRVNGICVVSCEQALCDLAGLLDPGALERALDDALVRELTTPDRIADFHRTVRPKRYKGSGALAVLLEDRVTDYEPPSSLLEAGLDRVFRHPDLPESVSQAAFPWWPEAAYRVDRFVPMWRRIIEVDGRRWHARFTGFEQDGARDHLAQMNGFEVTRFTFRQVVTHPTYALGVLLAIGRCNRAG